MLKVTGPSPLWSGHLPAGVLRIKTIYISLWDQNGQKGRGLGPELFPVFPFVTVLSKASAVLPGPRQARPALPGRA